MATRSELLAIRNTDKPQGTSVYKRNVPNSGAALRPKQPDAGVGSGHQVLADFLKEIAGPLSDAAFNKQKEDAEEQRKKGSATFLNSTKSQRLAFVKAIRDGVINESESPYFREGVQRAYASTLLEKYNSELFRKYEADGIKNKKESGALNDWLHDFNGTFSSELGLLHPDVIAEEFSPGQLGIRRQLTQKHYEHLNAEYRADARRTKEGQLWTILSNHLDPNTMIATNRKSIEAYLQSNKVDHDKRAIVLEKLKPLLDTYGKLTDNTTIPESLKRDLLALGPLGRTMLKNIQDKMKKPSERKESRVTALQHGYIPAQKDEDTAADDEELKRIAKERIEKTENYYGKYIKRKGSKAEAEAFARDWGARRFHFDGSWHTILNKQ